MPYRAGSRSLTDQERADIERLDTVVPRSPSGMRRYRTDAGLALIREVRRIHLEGTVTLGSIAGALGVSRQAVHDAIRKYGDA
jgi:hypothetical protein